MAQERRIAQIIARIFVDSIFDGKPLASQGAGLLWCCWSLRSSGPQYRARVRRGLSLLRKSREVSRVD